MEGNDFLTQHDKNPLFWVRDAEFELRKILDAFRGEISISNVHNTQCQINKICKGFEHFVEYLKEIDQINEIIQKLFSNVKTEIVKTYKKIATFPVAETGILCYTIFKCYK